MSVGTEPKVNPADDPRDRARENLRQKRRVPLGELVNESINQNKRGSKTQPLDEREIPARGGPEAALESNNLSRQIQDGLMTLNDNYRTVVVLRHFSEFSYREIGEILDIPEKTVKSRLYTARQAMKESLQARGVY